MTKKSSKKTAASPADAGDKPAQGICHLVGAGPGDPGLLTLKGRECLEQAEVVIYDYLSNAELLRHVPAGAEIIYAGKTAGRHALRQVETNAPRVGIDLRQARVAVVGATGDIGSAICRWLIAAPPRWRESPAPEPRCLR
jgi:hypothetical protein